MKQISIQITDETARQIEKLALYWGLPKVRHNTAVIERAVNTVYMFEVGTDEYRRRLKEMGASEEPDYLTGVKDG
jgi:hypothetical protein